MLATLALGLQSPSSVHAGTFVVDRFDDVFSAQACTSSPNDCSLRGAIEKAYGSAGADTITLPAGIYLLAPEPPPAHPTRSGAISTSMIPKI
jgi:hypothetical protein